MIDSFVATVAFDVLNNNVGLKTPCVMALQQLEQLTNVYVLPLSQHAWHTPSTSRASDTRAHFDSDNRVLQFHLDTSSQLCRAAQRLASHTSTERVVPPCCIRPSNRSTAWSLTQRYHTLSCTVTHPLYNQRKCGSNALSPTTLSGDCASHTRLWVHRAASHSVESSLLGTLESRSHTASCLITMSNSLSAGMLQLYDVFVSSHGHNILMLLSFRPMSIATTSPSVGSTNSTFVQNVSELDLDPMAPDHNIGVAPSAAKTLKKPSNVSFYRALICPSSTRTIPDSDPLSFVTTNDTRTCSTVWILN